MKYRKKPVIVDAVQWFKPGDHPAVITFIFEDYGPKYGIQTLEGTMWVNPGNWIVGPGARGEYWPVQDEIFKQTYEPADDEQKKVEEMLMWW